MPSSEIMISPLSITLLTHSWLLWHRRVIVSDDDDFTAVGHTSSINKRKVKESSYASFFPRREWWRRKQCPDPGRSLRGLSGIVPVSIRRQKGKSSLRHTPCLTLQRCIMPEPNFHNGKNERRRPLFSSLCSLRRNASLGVCFLKWCVWHLYSFTAPVSILLLQPFDDG